MADNVYTKIQKATGTVAPAGQTEGWVLIECARRLDQLSKAAELDVEEFIEQVRTNWRVWTVIQSEASDPNSTMSMELRQNLINLATFVDKKSIELLRNPDTKALSILISVNRQIGAGFMESMATPNNEQEEHAGASNKKQQLHDKINLINNDDTVPKSGLTANKNASKTPKLKTYNPYKK